MDKEKQYIGYERLHDWGSRQTPWIQKVIQEITDAQNIPSDEKISELCQLAIDEKNFVEQTTSDSQANDNKEPTQAVVILKSLEHLKGVNKIKEGGKIDFHERMTICFGENASGKTGYVRIIKKVAKSRAQKLILPNINKKEEKNLLPSFKVLFNVNGKDIELEEKDHETSYNHISSQNGKDEEWKEGNNETSYNHISSQIGVFDSHVALYHLTSQLNSTYTPQGIAPFPLAVKTVQLIQDELKKQKSQEVTSLTNLITDTPTLRKIQAIKSQDDLHEAIESSKISDDKKSEHDKLIKKKKMLESGDMPLRIQQANANKRIFQDTIKIASAVKEFNYDLYSTASSELLEFQSQLKKATEENFKDDNISGASSDHWKKFIEAGEEYTNQEKGGKDVYPSSGDKCIYCMQELRDNALVLLKKYRDYCNDQSKKDVEEARGRKRDLSMPIINLDIDGNKKEIENLKKDKESSAPLPSYFDAAIEIVEYAQTLKTFLQPLEKNDHKILPPSSKFEKSLPLLCKEVEEIDRNITSLSEHDKKQENDLNKIRNDVRLFEEKKNLNDVLRNCSAVNKIKKHLKISYYIEHLSSTQRSLTNELVAASKSMMEQGYQNNFIKECKKLHITPVEIETHGKEGSVERSLKPKTNSDNKPDLKDVLSEGEQRCIALADFLTEEIFLKESSCLVFDDPVSSLDYNYIDYVAERLVTISRDRQIVVFTHDIFFTEELIEKLNSEYHQERESSQDNNKEYYLHRIESDINSEYCGFVREKNIFKKSFSDLCEEIKKIIKIGNQTPDIDIRANQAMGGYVCLRKLCEYVVIHIVLMDTVLPYRKSVKVKGIAQIKDLNMQYATEKILPVFNKCSSFFHNQPVLKKETNPTISELEDDLKTIESLVESIKNPTKKPKLTN